MEPHPPTAERVTKRTLVLMAVAGRALLEMLVQQGHSEVAENLPRLRQWIEDMDIRSECEPEEWERIIAPTGSLSEQDLTDSVWRLEGIAVLAWSLGLRDLHRYDTLADADDLFAELGFLDPDRGRAQIEGAVRCPERELSLMGNQILAFHWRMRDYSLKRVAMDFIEFGKNCWFGPIELDWAEIAEGDLALAGNPISKAPNEVISQCMSSAMERHVAINWLKGCSELYSETDAST